MFGLRSLRAYTAKVPKPETLMRWLCFIEGDDVIECHDVTEDNIDCVAPFEPLRTFMQEVDQTRVPDRRLKDR